jgi:hypothetical protein
MLQMAPAMRVSKYKRKYKVKREPERFRVQAHFKKKRCSKSNRKTVYVKAHWRTRRTWKW